MDNDKKLISQCKLHYVIYNYIEPEIDEYKSFENGHWVNSSREGASTWYLYDGHTRAQDIGFRLCGDHWEVFNDAYDDNYVNIVIYPKHVDFVEDSKFTDFSREYMYGLYEKIKEVVERGV